MARRALGDNGNFPDSSRKEKENQGTTEINLN